MDTGILVAIKRGSQVEFLNIKGGEPVIATRQETVDKDLGKFQVASACANIFRIANSITTDGDTR